MSGAGGWNNFGITPEPSCSALLSWRRACIERLQQAGPLHVCVHWWWCVRMACGQGAIVAALQTEHGGSVVCTSPALEMPWRTAERRRVGTAVGGHRDV